MIEQHGTSRTDHYGWLKDERWQEVLRDPGLLAEDIRIHLTAENDYYEQAVSHFAGLRTMLFDEMRGRIEEEDRSVPLPDGPFAYGERFRQGGEHAIHIRTPRSGGEEQILFDGDAEAAGSEFFRVSAVTHSPDHSLIAYGIDRLGSEYYELRIRRTDTGTDLDEVIPSTDGEAVWAVDSRSLFYIVRDDNQRPKWLRRHIVGTDPSEDELVYTEEDDRLFMAVTKSLSGEFVFIRSGHGNASETRYLRADSAPGTAPHLIAPLQEDELYSVSHRGDHFYIHTNARDAVDFKVMRAPTDEPGRDHWEEWLPHRQGIHVLGAAALGGHFVRLERREALPRIVVSDYRRDNEFEIEFDEAAYAVSVEEGYEHDTTILRVTYESPATPRQTMDIDLATGDRTLLKTQQVPSGHDPSLYEVERISVTAQDGAEIPVTVLRLRTSEPDGSAPLLLYGYGSYGHTMPAAFNPSVLSIVDRGAIYAIAHIRGSAAKGRQWYLDGKLNAKPNSFSDFAEVAASLQELGYGRRGETVIYGGSAGGLLIGATLNLRPELFGGAVAAVPFVDALTTMSDPELPLTPPEWVEWGNPIDDVEAFATIRGYSPYDNIRSDVPYPPVLATGGLTDYRVTYWEPAKWVARLRDDAQGGPFFLKMHMGAGHAGAAGRFQRLEERSHDYAFALAVMGLAESIPTRHSI